MEMKRDGDGQYGRGTGEVYRGARFWGEGNKHVILINCESSGREEKMMGPFCLSPVYICGAVSCGVCGSFRWPPLFSATMRTPCVNGRTSSAMRLVEQKEKLVLLVSRWALQHFTVHLLY